MKFTRPIVLASSSPRRQYLMKESGFDFTVRKPDVEEDFPADMPADDVALFLARKKAQSFGAISGDELILTADTVVILGSVILNKPADRGEAVQMLSRLAGNVHRVITGVCIRAREKELSFQDETTVRFTQLSRAEIEFYVDRYKPFDKAGAYGAQDWFGMVGIDRIEGSYFNVMGLPVHRVYQALMHW